MSKSSYLQIIGRAGRAGQSEVGESFLFAKQALRPDMDPFKLVKSVQKNLKSAVPSNRNSITKVVLELICMGLARTRKDIIVFAEKTFAFACEKEKRKQIEFGGQSSGEDTSASTTATKPKKEAAAEAEEQQDEEETEEGILNLFDQALDMLCQSGFIEHRKLIEHEAKKMQEEKRMIQQVNNEVLEDNLHLLDSSESENSEEQQEAEIVPFSMLGVQHQIERPQHQEEEEPQEEEEEEKLQREDDLDIYIPLKFGIATFKSMLPVHTTATVKELLVQFMSKGFILNDEVQLCFLAIRPEEMEFVDQRTWEKVLPMLQKILTEKGTPRCNIMENLGFTNDFLQQFEAGIRTKSDITDPLGISLKRFFFAMILSDMINEKSYAECAKKYNIDKGKISSLMDSASVFTNMLAKFCAALEWDLLEGLLNVFSKRLGHGVRANLLELMEIPNVKAARARFLFANGFTTIEQVALADVEKMKAKVGLKWGTFGPGLISKIISSAKKIMARDAQKKYLEAKNICDALAAQR